MTGQEKEKEKIIEEVLLDVDQSKVDVLKDFVEEFRERIRGTVFEQEMLNSKESDKPRGFLDVT